jgi:site-specific recombinase XerD
VKSRRSFAKTTRWTRGTAAKAITYPIKHLENTFGLDRALDITTDRINAHIAQRQDSGAKNATINRELAALKRMFSLAMQAGKLSSKRYIRR